MNKKLDEYIKMIISSFEEIDDLRRQDLSQLSRYIREKSNQCRNIDLIFICTHNSRRSQFGQIWAQIAAYYYEIPNISTFSGGTEATAFNERAISAIERTGLIVDKSGNDDNPNYEIRDDEIMPPIQCFSKVYTDTHNPQTDFAAIMTCSDADENCPVVFGSEKRIKLMYDDPKVFDGTPEESIKYDKRCEQIAREMFFAFSKI